MKSKKKYSYIEIGIASPEEILSWSYGEVKKHETINYRTLKPERDGLFCEVIFGPTKDYTCACGKSKRLSKSEKKCDKCGVDITESKVRRERMGHIALASPVVHTWFLKNSPSKIALLLDMKSKYVEEIVYLASYIVVDAGSIAELEKGRILTEQEYSTFQREYGVNKFKALTGADAIKKLLQEIDLDATAKELREELKDATKQRREKLIKRLDVVEAFQHSGNKPEWMVMSVLPVIPPDLRPMVQLDGGRFATTDLNDLYRHILNRNSRLRRQIDARSPNLIIKNEKRMLQQAVDALIDNSKRKKGNDKNSQLKSLSDALKGKQGRFRQNLLGKRVDYSGRSVICVGPDLKMYQCGIPREMGLILFKPFIIDSIMKNYPDNPENGAKMNVRDAKAMIERGDPIAMTELEKIIVEHPVLLNRAPTLHRLGIQAFEPKLVEGKAIRLHPLACTAFNADFDGDQMAVHLPLSEEAQTEARLLMLASKNILAPKDGKPIVTPSQDMVLGNYYLTIEDALDPNEGKIFRSTDEVEMAYENEEIGFHTRVILPALALHERVANYMPKVIGKDKNPDPKDYYLITTYGKLLFNTIFPDVEPYSPYVCEADIKNLTECVPARFLVKMGTNIPEYLKNLECPHPFKKKFLSVVIAEVFKKFKLAETSKTLDKMKDLGFKYSTVSGITVAASDIQIIDTKYEHIICRDDNVVAEVSHNKYLNIEYYSVVMNKIYTLKSVIDNLKVGEKVKEKQPIGLSASKSKDVPEKVTSDVNGVITSIDNVKKGKDVLVKLTIRCERDYLTYDPKSILVKTGDAVKKNDIIIKGGVLSDAQIRVDRYDVAFKRGLITASERSKNVITVWSNAKKDLETDITDQANRDYIKNHIYMMGDSGARGSVANFVQLSGIRGLMAKPNGESMDIPIKSSLKEGLTMSDFFVSTHGARKGSTDTALKTAESGYLTRRLVDVSQDVIVTEDECGTDKGMLVADLTEGGSRIEPLYDRIRGRFNSKPIYDPNTNKVLYKKNTFITDAIAEDIVNKGVKEVWVRTLLTCNCKNGVCVRCYGSDLSTGEIVEKGEVVGIIAAQSIGEPGTQLTMRTFHSGGVAGGEDITQGLPRIQELFEAREPKGKALISEIKGRITKLNLVQDNRYEITVENDSIPDIKEYITDAGKRVIVSLGDEVEPGQRLTEGLIHPKELLKASTVEAVEQYILKEVQKVYRSQGVDIADKHVEIIAKRMISRIKIVGSGDSLFLPGTMVNINHFRDVNKELILEGKNPATGRLVLLGITKASLETDSFLSAASFQETTRVLTEAAIRGKRDNLEGLKENIIIGGLIPAGTGLAFANPEIITDDEVSNDILKQGYKSSSR